MISELLKLDLPLGPLAEPLARELCRQLLSTDAAGAVPPAVAELLRQGISQAVESYLRDRQLLTIEELAGRFGWSVRKLRAWAREVGLPHAAEGADVFRADDVRAALDFKEGRKSEACRELERQIGDLQRTVDRLLEAERRRQEVEHLSPLLHPVRNAA